MDYCSDQAWMRAALEEARLAFDSGEVPIGAVVVSEGRIIARAHNLCEATPSAAAHAELLAIDQACRARGSWRLTDCTLYVTLEPCPMCTGAAINARLSRIVYAAPDPRAGACGSLLNLPAYPLEARPEMTGGVLREEALTLLRTFFTQKRKQKT